MTIEALETATVEEVVEKDDDEPEATEFEEEVLPPPTFAEVDGHIGTLRQYAESVSLPSEATMLLDGFAHQVRIEKNKRASHTPSLKRFFQAKPKANKEKTRT